MNNLHRDLMAARETQHAIKVQRAAAAAAEDRVTAARLASENARQETALAAMVRTAFSFSHAFGLSIVQKRKTRVQGVNDAELQNREVHRF